MILCTQCNTPHAANFSRCDRCRAMWPDAKLGRPCRYCGLPGTEADRLGRTNRHEDCKYQREKPQDATVHPFAPWEEDEAAQRFVMEHPWGATLEEIAGAFGVSKERVRQIEHDALRKLERALPEHMRPELVEPGFGSPTPRCPGAE